MRVLPRLLVSGKVSLPRSSRFSRQCGLFSVLPFALFPKHQRKMRKQAPFHSKLILLFYSRSKRVLFTRFLHIMNELITNLVNYPRKHGLKATRRSGGSVTQLLYLFGHLYVKAAKQKNQHYSDSEITFLRWREKKSRKKKTGFSL